MSSGCLTVLAGLRGAKKLLRSEFIPLASDPHYAHSVGRTPPRRESLAIDGATLKHLLINQIKPERGRP